MREKIKTFFCILFLACALPYIITLCFQGKEGKEAFLPMDESGSSADASSKGKEEKEEEKEPDGQEEEKEPDAQEEEDAEMQEYLAGVVASQMPLLLSLFLRQSLLRQA